MISIAVFASGNGTNFNKIADYFKDSTKIKVKLLIYDKLGAECKNIADRNNIPAYYIDFNTLGKDNAEQMIVDILKNNNIKLSVLAGFMRILSKSFIDKFKHPVINIHPSLLPEFKGRNSISRAYNSNEIYTGITVHFVNDKIDDGEIIFQKSILIDRTKSVDDLEDLIHKIEHENYPVIIKNICETLITKGV